METDIKCFNCGQKGHIASKCPKKKQSKDSDNSSVSSKSSKSKLDELEKIVKKTSKQFTQLKAQLEDSKDDDNDDSEEEHSHLQFFSLAHYCVSPEKYHYNVSMKQSTGKLEGLDLRNVILLDSQSTMSLFCKKRLVTKIRKSNEKLTLRSNGGSMKVGRIASIN